MDAGLLLRMCWTRYLSPIARPLAQKGSSLTSFLGIVGLSKVLEPRFHPSFCDNPATRNTNLIRGPRARPSYPILSYPGVVSDMSLVPMRPQAGVIHVPIFLRLFTTRPIRFTTTCF